MSLAQDLLEEWRIWFLITALIGAGIAIGPHYESVPREDGSGNTTTIATNINQGLSIQGGARVLIEPDMSGIDPEREQAVIDNIITTLKTRVQAFGLQDMTIRPVSSLTGEQTYIRIEMAGADTDQLKELITRQGIFEAGFSMDVQDGDTISFGDSEYSIEASNESVTINGQKIDTNTTATVSTGDNNITVEYTNSTGSNHRLRAIAFEGADITGVDINPTQSGVNCQSRNSCSFEFQVSVERSAAQRFQSIAQNFDEGPQYLQGTRLVLTLDDSQVSSLQVRNVFKNQIVETPTITGGGNSREQALQEMDELQSTLQSGALPVPIEVVSTNNVSARLGQQFMQVAIISILAAVIAVGILIFLRYQNPNIAIPIMITGFSEVFILLAVFSQATISAPVVLALAVPTIIGLAAGFKKKDLKVLMLPFGTGFIIAIMQFAPSLDLAAIAGIIAAVGTGVDDQIIITDERSVKRSLSLKKRLKRAFFIIFTSAASTIGAMLPVMTIGAGAVRGFAITTILGVLIGISITRPAYATILDHVQ